MSEQAIDIAMDPKGLYREDVFTDRQVGSIRQLTPVDAEGAIDGSRDVIYQGSAQILTPGGALPLNFELEGPGLDDAVEQFAQAAEEALNKTLEELKEMQRQAASSIVVPGSGGAGGLPGGGMPGGGLQMP